MPHLPIKVGGSDKMGDSHSILLKSLWFVTQGTFVG